MKKIVKFIPILLAIIVLSGCFGGRNDVENENDSVPQLEDLGEFDKNTTIEDLYKKSSSLPPHHTLCVPVKKYFCGINSCEVIDPKVFNLLGGNRDNSNISRCDSMGCDTYKTIFDDSGNYKNIQPTEPRGFMFKMSYDTVDKKYLEIATSGLDTYITYGYCLYDYELP